MLGFLGGLIGGISVGTIALFILFCSLPIYADTDMEVYRGKQGTAGNPESTYYFDHSS